MLRGHSPFHLFFTYCMMPIIITPSKIVLVLGGCPYPNIPAHRIPYMLKSNYRMPKPDHLDDEMLVKMIFVVAALLL